MSKYFSYLPNVYVRLDSIRKQGVDPYVQAKNIFRRIKIRSDLQGAALGFQQYSIGANERPDEVAQKAYGDPTLDWVILISNNIINIYNEWPMHEGELMDYCAKKYNEAGGIHHYETLELKNPQGDIVVQEGWEVNHNYTYTDWENITHTDLVMPISNYQHEITQNDYKRNIYLLKPAYLTDFIAEFQSLVEYLPNEEIDENELKKTFAVIDENYLTAKTTYTSDIGRTAITKKAAMQDFADRVFAVTAASSDAAIAAASSNTNTSTNDSGVVAGTQDSSSTSTTSSSSSSSSNSGY
tara:strand:+ start:1392 stop:2282 length:891 start_codon:yes stop_codon:yes gene_type:complete